MVKINLPTSATAMARKKLRLSLLPKTGFIRAAKYAYGIITTSPPKNADLALTPLTAKYATTVISNVSPIWTSPGHNANSLSRFGLFAGITSPRWSRKKTTASVKKVAVACVVDFWTLSCNQPRIIASCRVLFKTRPVLILINLW